MELVGFFTNRGFIVPVAFLKRKFGPLFDDLLQKLTIVYIPTIGQRQYVKLYEYTLVGKTKCIILPRTLIMAFRGTILDRIDVLIPEPVRIINDCNIENRLHNNQKILVDYLMKTVFNRERISDGSATTILDLRAGMGKTYVAAGVIAALGLKTLYIVPKKPLALQAVNDLRGNNIGTVSELRKGVPSADITVVVINTAISMEREFYAQFGLCILDEVHAYCSEKRRSIFRLCSTRAVLAMSATTNDRNDGYDIIAHKELAAGGIIRAEDVPGFAYDEANAFRCTVDVISYKGPPEYTRVLTHPSTGRMFTPYMNAQFMRDPARCRLILSKLKELYDWVGPEGQRHCIYVFCEERAPLGVLMKQFVEDNALRDCEISVVGEFIGGISNDKINQMRESARIFLTTYGYAGTGVSIDKMTAAIFMTPRKSNMKQILFRIMRRGGDPSIMRRVIDIVDVNTPIKKQYQSRLTVYNMYGLLCNQYVVMG